MRNLLLLGLASAGAAITAVSLAATQAPSPTALWQEIQVLQKGHALMLESKAYQPGSRTVDTYTIDLANQAANDAIRKAGSIEKVRRYPNGALVVKVNFNERRKLTGVTAMLKLDGYDQADRNWVMASYSPTGKVVGYGKVPACIACHAMVTTQDFVFAPPPEQLLPVPIWKAFFPKQNINPVYAQLLQSHADAVVK
jgi:hypothetical protein